MDRTLILVKPDAFGRGLTGEVIARFERKGLVIAALKRMTVDRALAERHYAEHAEKPFFAELVEFITSAPLVAMVLEGREAVTAARQVIDAEARALRAESVAEDAERRRDALLDADRRAEEARVALATLPPDDRR